MPIVKIGIYRKAFAAAGGRKKSTPHAAIYQKKGLSPALFSTLNFDLKNRA